MRFLTVKQPYAWALFHGKPIENRTQLFNYRGLVGIHAGTSWHDPGGVDPNVIRAAISQRPGGPGVYGPGTEFVDRRDKAFTTSAVIGVARLVDCHRAEPGCCESPWAQHYDRATHLVFEEPRLLTEPVPARGELGLWNDRCAVEWEAPREAHDANCGLTRKVLERLPVVT